VVTEGGQTYCHEYFVLIKKIQLYKAYPKEDGETYYSPEDSASIGNIHYIVEDKYFPVEGNATTLLKDINFIPAPTGLKPILEPTGERKSSINIKESNYFNAIQSIAETFECWPLIEANHDATGNIVNFPGKDYSKRIYFKNTIGQENHAGFRYGVNSKDIKRTMDSNQIVSKLIVKQNANEYAPNGFSTIARAPANEIKDNVIYNFDYYVSQKMINALDL
jgi:hypothetical protein